MRGAECAENQLLSALTNHVGDSHFLRDGRAISIYDAGRLVALALGATVAGTGGVECRDGFSPIINFETCSMLGGHRGSG